MPERHHLVIDPRDQLALDAAAVDGFDPEGAVRPLYHAHLSAALNLKLWDDHQDPPECYWTGATGTYTQRMSPHGLVCRYDPAERVGESACPFTTLCRDFLLRHEAALARSPRMALQFMNLARLGEEERQALHARAEGIHRGAVGGCT